MIYWKVKNKTYTKFMIDSIKKSHLKKVELFLDNHRCSIEGRLSSEQLIKLLEILEEASC